VTDSKTKKKGGGEERKRSLTFLLAFNTVLTVTSLHSGIKKKLLRFTETGRKTKTTLGGYNNHKLGRNLVKNRGKGPIQRVNLALNKL